MHFFNKTVSASTLEGVIMKCSIAHYSLPFQYYPNAGHLNIISVALEIQSCSLSSFTSIVSSSAPVLVVADHAKSQSITPVAWLCQRLLCTICCCECVRVNFQKPNLGWGGSRSVSLIKVLQLAPGQITHRHDSWVFHAGDHYSMTYSTNDNITLLRSRVLT